MWSAKSVTVKQYHSWQGEEDWLACDWDVESVMEGVLVVDDRVCECVETTNIVSKIHSTAVAKPRVMASMHMSELYRVGLTMHFQTTSGSS